MRRRLVLLMCLLSLVAVAACGRPTRVSPGNTASSAGVTASPGPTAVATASTPASTCPVPATPSPRAGMAAAYMPNLDEVMLFGGEAGHDRLADTWTWKAGCWTSVGPSSQGPASRTEPATTYDPNAHDVLLYGGAGCGGWCFDTWTWDGKAWTNINATGPQLIGKPVAGFDPVGNRVLLFGWGPDGSQTWSWSGAWVQLHPTASPQPRVGASLALDPSRGELMLFGGRSGSVGVLNDTWLWTGSSWAQLSPSKSPQPRYNAAMTTWAAGKVVILVGGSIAPGFGDAWSWDGSTWSPIASIGVRLDASAVDIGPKILIIGGSDGSADLNDTQSWDGAVWSKA